MSVIQLPDNCCCKDCDMVPDFSWTQGSGCAFTFSDDSTPTVPGSPANWWEWDFGDGTTSNVQNPTHDYGTPDDCGAWLVRLRVSCDGGANYRQITKWVTCEPCEFFPVIEYIGATGLGTAYIAGVPDNTRCGYVAWIQVQMHGDRFPVAATITVDGEEICSSLQVIQQSAAGLFDIMCWGVTDSNPATINVAVTVVDSCGCEAAASAERTIQCGEVCVPNCNGVLPDEVLVTISGVVANPQYEQWFNRVYSCEDLSNGAFVAYRTSACRWEGKYYRPDLDENIKQYVHIIVTLGDIEGNRGYFVQVRYVDRIDPWSNASHYMWIKIPTNGVCVGNYGPTAPYLISIAPATFLPQMCTLTGATVELQV